MSLEPIAEPRFDVAVSFAGEDRSFVEDVVRGVSSGRVFYDEDFVVETWGRDLVEYFTQLYQNDARYVVMFISSKYAEKSWTTLERRSALAGALRRNDPYILPVRLDDTALPGLLPTVGYLDARRVGIAGVVDAINAKLAGTQIALPVAPPLLDGKVPRSDEAVLALVAEKPSYWEYLLFGALLLVKVNKLEPKYRDFTMGYGHRTGQYVGASNLPDYAQAAMGSILSITENFNSVLSPGPQEVAFGRPGASGNVDAIYHLAERFVSVYEDYLDWSAELRGVSATGEHTQLALRELAKAAIDPIESIRAFLRNFVAQLDTMSDRVAGGEYVEIVMTVTVGLDPRIMAEFARQVKLAIDRER